MTVGGERKRLRAEGASFTRWWHAVDLKEGASEKTNIFVVTASVTCLLLIDICV